MIDVRLPQFRGDWQAYLIAADQREEAGDDKAARVLRRQGEALRALLAHFADFGGVWHTGGATRVDLPCGAYVRCRNKNKVVVLLAYTVASHGLAYLARKMEIKKSLLHKDDAYLPRRIRELFTLTVFGSLFEQTPEETDDG